MSDQEPSELDDAVALFVHGARELHVGHYLDSRPLERKGLKSIRKGVEAIDRLSPNGRDPLLAFLDHKEEGVRTVAAAALWQSHSERAIATLRAVDLYGITEASGLAMKILMFRGRFNPVPADPRIGRMYDPAQPLHHWIDHAFHDSVQSGETTTDVYCTLGSPPERVAQ